MLQDHQLNPTPAQQELREAVIKNTEPEVLRRQLATDMLAIALFKRLAEISSAQEEKFTNLAEQKASGRLSQSQKMQFDTGPFPLDKPECFKLVNRDALKRELISIHEPKAAAFVDGYLEQLTQAGLIEEKTVHFPEMLGDILQEYDKGPSSWTGFCVTEAGQEFLSGH